MCGRARCALSREEVATTSGVSQERWRDADRYQPDQNMSPGHWSPVIKFDKNGELELQTMKWGLVPGFSKAGEKPDHFRMFNARSETVPEKAIFKRLLGRQRCVVLLNGFYEWAKEHKGKQPYYIYLDGDVTKMAGLFDCWEAAEGGPLYTFTILTTDSSKRLSWLHDRMPVILHSEKEEKSWLNNTDLDAKSFAQVCEPFNGEALKWHAVTTAMGNMRYHGDDCAKEIKKGNIATFFKPKKVSTAPVSKSGQDSAQPAVKEEQPSQEAMPANSPSKATDLDSKDRETPHKRPHSQTASSPTKKQKQSSLPKGQGQISAFFSPNSK